MKELYEHNPKIDNSNYNKPIINYKENNFQFNKTFQTEVTEKKHDISDEEKPRDIKNKINIKTIKNKPEKTIKYDKPKTQPKTFINTYRKEKIQEDKSISRGDISNISNNDRSIDRSRSYSNTSIVTVDKIDYNKVYSKREKAELHLSRGIAKEYKKFELEKINFHYIFLL